MKPSIFSLISILTLIVAVLFGSDSPAQTFETKAEYAYLLDVDTGVVLLEKHADAAMSPASMSKLMTLLVVFEALKDGTLAPAQKLYVSDNAWRKGGAPSGGSTMFLDARSRVSVSNLITGIIVQSGNDACITLAEALAGSEDAFAAQLNERAAEMGLDNSNFTNATGLPDPEHKMTARDLVTLARKIIIEHGDFYRLFSKRSFTWNGITQSNRNPLLYANIGADGLKTGHTRESGYGLVASAAKETGRRIVFAINGLDSKMARAAEARRLTNWAFRSFVPQILLEAGKTIPDLEIPVWHGVEPRVALVAEKQFNIIVPRRGRNKMTITVTYDKPASAPIAKGQKVAVMRVTARGLPTQKMVLVASHDVARAGLFARAWASLGYLVFGQR